MTGSNYYIVKKGDSLYSIANRYNTTVSELKTLNNLSTNNLDIGQVLKIPTETSEEAPSEEGEIIYTVKSGDSLYRIASLYNTTIDEIKSLNNLTSNTLSIGQKLKIPGTSEESSTEYVTYTVVSGDSLYSIAKKYNTTANEIKEFNNLDSNLLSIGQILRIPTSTSSESTYLNYTVVSGDNLYSIARRYNTTVDEIKTLNNLTSNTLSVGQTLKIPISTTNVQTYTVVSGDSLYSIAKKFNTTVNEIKSLNNLSSNLLSIGQILKIPN